MAALTLTGLTMLAIGGRDETESDIGLTTGGVATRWRGLDDVAARARAVGVAPEPGAGSGDVLGDAAGAVPEPVGEVVASEAPTPLLDVREGTDADGAVLLPQCSRGPIEAQICAVFGDAGPQAIRVAACESGRSTSGLLDGNWATSGDSYGLFQIHYIHAARFPGFWEHWQEAEFNIMMAWTLYVEHGYSWQAWSCRWAAW